MGLILTLGIQGSRPQSHYQTLIDETCYSSGSYPVFSHLYPRNYSDNPNHHQSHYTAEVASQNPES